MLAYLAGAMEFAHDGGCGWRADIAHWLQEELGHGVLDPTVLEHDQLDEADRKRIPALKQNDLEELRRLALKIVRYDVDLVINKCDYVICLWNESTQLGCGSAGEITVATWTRKPVYMLLDYPREKASTWMIGCTTSIHGSWDDLKETLLRAYGKDHHEV